MGAERWLRFKSVKEADKVRAYLEPLRGGELGVFGQYGCWFDWTSKMVLEVGYGSDGSSGVFAAFLCRELAQRFEVKQIGSDHVGWYTDEEWRTGNAKDTYGDYDSWVAWMKDYKIEFTGEYRAYDRAGEAEFIRAPLLRCETTAVQWLKALDNKDTEWLDDALSLLTGK